MIRFNLQHKNIDYTLALHVVSPYSLPPRFAPGERIDLQVLQAPHPTTEGSCAYAMTRDGRSGRQSTLIITIEGAKDVWQIIECPKVPRSVKLVADVRPDASDSRIGRLHIPPHVPPIIQLARQSRPCSTSSFHLKHT